MANPWAGEAALVIDGERHVLRLTLGALAELETSLETGTFVELVERFETGQVGARDVLSVVVAGLRGGGWTGRVGDLTAADVEGGVAEAAKVAGLLLVRAFTTPVEGAQ